MLALVLAVGCSGPARPQPQPPPPPQPSPAEADRSVCEEVKTFEIRGQPVAAPFAVTQVYCEHHRDACCVLTASLRWQWRCDNDRNQRWYQTTCVDAP
jgi:hypothetical protein